MQYFNKINFNEIYKIVEERAKYQKVLILFDKQNYTKQLDQVVIKIKKNCVLFMADYSSLNEEQISKVLENDYKLVLISLTDENYIKLCKYYDFSAITIDIFNGNILPVHLKENASCYLFYENEKLNKTEQLYLSNYLVEWKWRSLLTGKNFCIKENEIMCAFNKTDLIESSFFKCDEMWQELVDIKAEDYDLYLFIRLMAIKYLFLSFLTKTQIMIDVYKVYENNLEELNFIYLLYNDERVNFVFKNYNKYMLDYIDSSLTSQVETKYKKENIFNILRIINNLAKNIKKDNLLKYCYLYGIFEKI